MEGPIDKQTYGHIVFDSNWPYLTLTDLNWSLLTYFDELTEKSLIDLPWADKKIWNGQCWEKDGFEVMFFMQANTEAAKLG